MLLCASLTLVGAVATQLLTTRFVPLPPLAERIAWENWGSLVPFGAICGALLGNLCWVALKPSERVTRATLLCVVANVLVWIAFLLFNPPLPESEFVEIAANRARADQSGDSLDLITDQPIVVAGRWSGTYGSVNTADRALGFFAGPAVMFMNFLVVPPRYIGSDATKSESWVTAGVGFVLSTSFWMAVGGGMSAIRRGFQRRQAARHRTDPVSR